MPSEGGHVPNLSREMRLTLRCVADGLDNHDVADELGISYEAAKKRVSRFSEEHSLDRYSVVSWAKDHLACCLAIS
jgi:DNA-binding NarL/FixJ family response regulator